MGIINKGVKYSKCVHNVSMHTTLTLTFFVISRHQHFLLFRTKMELAVHLEGGQLHVHAVSIN